MSRPAVRRISRRFNAAVAGLVATTGLACVSERTLAQACTFEVKVTPSVVNAGQSANVDVLAQFPPSMYAFASAQFDVHASSPAWSFASSGLVAGGDVLGMNVWQSHLPQSGLFADPANPYRVWRGTFTPMTTEPALVEIKADPSAISVYPSQLTSSSVPGQAKGDSGWLIVNPLQIGRWMGAPGRGTRARISDDVILGGKIITGENPSATILIGLLLPAVQKVDETQVLVRFEGRPESFAASVDLDGFPGEQLSLGFTRVDLSAMGDAGAYGVVADLGQPDGTPATFSAFLRGVRVATGEMRADAPAFWVDRVPEMFTTRRAGGGGLTRVPLRSATGYKLPDLLVSSYSSSGGATPRPLRLVLTDGRVVEADAVVVAAPRAASANNLKQIGLGLHTYEATGVRSMMVRPAR
jgi:hypothetical protein